MAGGQKPFQAQTNGTPKSLADDKLKPTSEMHILVGGPYGESHPYGHTALYIKIKSTEYVYDFGRYRAVYPEDVAFGYRLEREDSPRGEGILRIWNSFSAYIAEENSTGRVTSGYKYKVFDYEASRAIDYYQSLTQGVKSFSQTASRASFKLSTDYFALGPNCTTLSIDGAIKVIPSIMKGSEKFIKPEDVLPFKALTAMKLKYGTPERIFLPANLKKYMDTAPAIAPVEVTNYGSKK